MSGVDSPVFTVAESMPYYRVDLSGDVHDDDESDNTLDAISEGSNDNEGPDEQVEAAREYQKGGIQGVCSAATDAAGGASNSNPTTTTTVSTTVLTIGIPHHHQGQLQDNHRDTSSPDTVTGEPPTDPGREGDRSSHQRRMPKKKAR